MKATGRVRIVWPAVSTLWALIVLVMALKDRNWEIVAATLLFLPLVWGYWFVEPGL